MATSILGEIYKEAAATSKGVVKMNNTLTKIYDDQEKGNKRQDKFITTLTKNHRRAEREDKKRQSDLKKLISGSSPRGTKSDNKDGLDLGDGFGGIVGSIIGGITKSLGVFKFALGAIFTKKFAFLAALGPGLALLARPILRNLTGGGGEKNLDPIATGDETLPTQQEVRENQQDIPGTLVDSAEGIPILPTGEEFVDSFTLPGGNKFRNPLKGPIKPPSSAIKSNNIFTKGINAIKGAGKGLKGLFGKLLGPVMLVLEMKDTVIDLWQKKQYKNLTRYILKTLVAFKIGTTVGTAAMALSGLLGLATGGAAALPAFIISALAATTATNYSEKYVDEALKRLGLYDDPRGMTDGETTTDTSPDAPEIEGLTGKDLVSANQNKQGIVDTLQKAQGLATGGFAGQFTVPGSGQGDTYRTFLPEGSFVLNKVAAAEMFARGGSPSGMAPVILEPGEKVFMPGDPLMDIAMAFNSSFSRFQQGGIVQGDGGGSRGSSQPAPSGQPREGSGVGVKAIISAAESNIGLSKGAGEQCANTTRAVLKAAGHPAAEKVTQIGDLDPEGTAYNGRGYAASFAGSDMGTVNRNFNDIQAGQIMLWKDTYRKFADQPAGAITHVGIAGEGNTQYDHDKRNGWRKTTRESPNFVASIDLNGEASGPGDGGESTSSSGSSGSGSKSSDDGGGVFGAIGAALSPITNAIGGMFGDGGVGSQLLDAFTSKLGSFASGIGEELKGVDTEGLMGQIKESMSQMGAGIAAEMNEATGQVSAEAPAEMKGPAPQVKASHTPIAGALQRIKEVMDPENTEAPTIVQLVPSGGEQEATLAGSANQNLPPGLSVRCSSWAAADYRNDRSLNCETP